MSFKLIRILFYITAVYDGLLGIAFLFFPLTVFDWYGVTRPNHAGYVQFPAMLLIVFSIMFLQIGNSPVQYRHMIPYGILLKVAYCTSVFMYWFTINIPDMWKPFAVCDAVFGLLFLWAYMKLGKEQNVSGRNEL